MGQAHIAGPHRVLRHCVHAPLLPRRASSPPQPLRLPLSPSYPSPAQLVSPLAYVTSHAAPLQPSAAHAAAAATGGGGAAGGGAGGGAATSVPPSILTSCLTLYRDELATEPVALRACSPERKLREGPVHQDGGSGAVHPDGSSHPHAYAHSLLPLLRLQPLRSSLLIPGIDELPTPPKVTPALLERKRSGLRPTPTSEARCSLVITPLAPWCTAHSVRVMALDEVCMSHVTCTVLTIWLAPHHHTPHSPPIRLARSDPASGEVASLRRASLRPTPQLERRPSQPQAKPERFRRGLTAGDLWAGKCAYISPISPLYLAYISHRVLPRLARHHRQLVARLISSVGRLMRVRVGARLRGRLWGRVRCRGWGLGF